jgi:signal transduction histidine kinase
VNELDHLRSFDRINLSSTFFQATIVVAFAVAHLGATRHFRRPAMRALAVFWLFFALAACINIFSTWSGAVWQSREISRALTTIVIALSAASIPFARSATRSMASLGNAPPSWRTAGVWAATLFVVHGTGVFSLGAWMPDQRVYAVTWSRALVFIVAVIPAWNAWRDLAACRAIGHVDCRAVRLLALGFSALALRQFVSLGLGLRVGLPDLPAPLEIAAIAGEVLTIMAMGALSLLAITAEELWFEQQQAAALAGAQARLAAGERMESLGRLAAGVAHDFNNMLQIVVLATAALKARAADDDSRTALSEVDSATRHGRALVRQLLDFARPPRHDGAACDAARQLEGISALLRSLIPRGIDFGVTVHAAGAQVFIEPTAFEQVVINLVTNARDATPPGGRVAVTLETVTFAAAESAAIELRAGAYVRLAVSDTGTGIAPEMIPRIFEPFFTTKQADRGTGLGLSTVHGVANGCGGGVHVHSRVGEGTTFEVYFPTG